MKNKKQEEVRKELCILHPCGLLVYRDGKVLVPRSGVNPEHFTYGSDSYGYNIVRYQGKTYLVHRLVAECFVPNPECKETVDHINMVRNDNRVENLRWASYKDQQNFEGQNVQKKKSKPALQCDLDGNLVHLWPSTMECQRNGYDHSAISQCCNKKYIREGNNVYRGYIWQYAKEEAII